ncbi:hypothetical protein ASPZODRAFT_133806 [Penicilliopsis zonata CBS 506.65]|uniref:Transferase family protein n=1 Tax=Penicilliopsis zonata CBS 506.65 TaxID=1073090 RepID=A0A1L9SFI5_9EURO|nr:hypothetical protein ASPZODRAFT_133806 [Penicilliopsis zonata CBS 506.65]OJJ45939.1 hypothetical protein ASPZODRAFT_133806 [Penicilliopsis zonata CBS 506.65]
MERTTYGLSDLDKGGLTKSVQFVLFYALPATTDLQKVISSLLAGVENATHHLPLMAGNLQFVESGKLAILSPPGSSIDVKICRLEDSQSFSALAKDLFSPNDLDLSPFLPSEASPGKPSPVCLIQLSLIEGGILMGLRVSHAAADWTSLDTFLTLICQGSQAFHHQKAMPPSPLDLARDLNRAPYNTPAPDPAFSQQDRLAHLPLFHIMEKSQFQFKPPPVTRAGIYRISEPTIQQLKTQCSPHLDQVDYITSYDCIAALIWTALTRARLRVRPGQENAVSRFVHPIDVRSRDPEHRTSPRYFGNAVIGSLAGPVPAHVLATPGVRGLAAAATQIRQSIHAVDVSTIGHFTALQASLSDTQMLLPNADFADMDLFMNTWATGNAAKYELGSVGRPVAFRVKVDMPAACAMILPDLSGDEARVFDILVQAPMPEYQVLTRDPQFLRYFEPVV